MVINKYKEWIQKETARPKLAAPVEKQLPMSTESKEEIQKQNFEIIDNWVKEKGEVPLFANWSEAFLHMERVKLIEMDNDAKQMFLDNVTFELEEEKKKLRLERSNYGHISNMLESKVLLKKECRKRFIIKYYENK